MHQILGYSWNELASLLGVVSIIAGAIGWLINHGAKTLNKNIYSVLEPFADQLNKLNDNLIRLNQTFDKQREDFEALEREVNKHQGWLERHDERFKTLFKEVEEDKK